MVIKYLLQLNEQVAARSTVCGNNLQFMGHEEGNLRPTKDTNNNITSFDYFLKDHLGNVRMVFTGDRQLDIYPVATLEGPLPNA